MRIACPPQNAAPWCSGLTYCPVKAEIAGSNPVGVATHSLAAGPASAPSSRTPETPEERDSVELCNGGYIRALNKSKKGIRVA